MPFSFLLMDVCFFFSWADNKKIKAFGPREEETKGTNGQDE